VVDDSLIVQRPRESTYPLISVDEAMQIVLAEADVMDVENLHLTGWIYFCYNFVDISILSSLSEQSSENCRFL